MRASNVVSKVNDFSQVFTSGTFCVRLARTRQEISDFQNLRYRTFYTEGQGYTGSEDVMHQQRDFDAFDDLCDHLIVIDEESNTIVGGYRLIPEEVAQEIGRFYSSSEFDLSPLKNYPGRKLELGRACVDPLYRNKRVIALLWQGIEQYIRHHHFSLLFGCANFSGTDASSCAQSLSFLHHFYLAPASYRPIALEISRTTMDLMPKESISVDTAFRNLPPLIRGYLRLGGMVGEGAFIDKDFHSLDVCILVETDKLAQRYIDHYARYTV